MSTRANVIIKDNYDKLYFYRHSDGYPEGTLPTLERLVGMYNSGQIRKNVPQSAGWLILIGADEYNVTLDIDPEDDFMGWKVGAYEPTTGIHGDIEYLYIIDLSKEVVSVEVLEDWTGEE